MLNTLLIACGILVLLGVTAVCCAVLLGRATDNVTVDWKMDDFNQL